MTFTMYEFDDLPEGWVVEEQSPSNVLFHRPDREAYVRLHQDEDHDTWVMLWEENGSDQLLFKRKFGSVGDAIRVARSTMSFYNTLYDRVVHDVMNLVSLATVCIDELEEPDAPNEDIEPVTDMLREALREGDYETLRQVRDTITSHVEIDQEGQE